MPERPAVLFACRANAGRSVTGTVLARHYASDRVSISSAGSEPGDAVHPEVAAVLVELGLDVSHETPKGFDPDGRYDVVVTMGCGETCPVYPGARYEDWAVPDPAGRPREEVRHVVADVDARVRGLLTSLVPGLSLGPSVVADLRR